MNSPTEIVAALIHKGDKRGAAQCVADFCKIPLTLRDDNPTKYLPILQNYLHVLLESGKPHEAASILWPESAFSFKPQYTRDVWKLYDESSMGLIMGAGSCSKSFGMGVRLFLEWIRDPAWTTIKVLGPSEDHLESNLFSHLVQLHNTASLPMPGVVGELFIGLSRRNQLSSIKGVVIPIGQVKKAGRLQGAKRKPRPAPHPKFGPLSRLFIFIDEVENVPGGLWSDVDNILSNIQEKGASEGFKIFGAYNPTNRDAEVGKRAEPVTGWETFDPEKDFRWKSTRGWDVLRLDGEKSENVIQNRIVYPGLQTRAGLELIALNGGGISSPGYCSMGRGMYPPTGIELAIVPPGMLAKMRGDFIWLETPEPCAGFDIALEGGAAAVYTLGRCGMASGMKLPPSLEFPQGRTIMFKDARGRSTPRWGAQADQQFILPKGDTIKMSGQSIEVSRRAGVKNHLFACDRTGHGAGVADLIKNDWGGGIHDVNYSQGPSSTKIMLEDTKTCEEDFSRLCCELWWALRSFGEFGFFLISASMDMTKLTEQLTQRKYKNAGKKKAVESKKDYISRGKTSPDEADSLTLMLHAARKGCGIIPSMKGGTVLPDVDGFDGWEDERVYPGGVRIDCTNRTDYLDSN